MAGALKRVGQPEAAHGVAQAVDAGSTLFLQKLQAASAAKTGAQMARDVAAAEGIDASGYRTVVNTNADAQQSVRHLHVHVLGRRRVRAL